jgi:outer membrane protein
MKLKQLFTAAAVLACATGAHAQSAGSIILESGWIHLAPQSSSDALTINSIGGFPVHDSVQGTGANVSGADTLGVSATYFVTDHIAPEFVFGIPPKFDLGGTGSLTGLGQLGTVKQWSPTLLLKYYFGSAQQKLRPYLGLGVTRVWYTDGTVTNPGLGVGLASAVAGFPVPSAFVGPTTVSSIKSSWAPVYNGGLTWQFDKHWSAGLSISYIPLKTTAVFNTPVLGQNVQSTAHIKINPIVTYLNIGYRF